MKSLIGLFILGFSLNASATLKVLNADGWEVDDVKNDKFAQIVVPGADTVIHRAIKIKEDQTYNMTITVRKAVKQSSDELKDNPDTWLKALFSAEKLKRISAQREKLKVLNIDGEKRFIGEITYRGEAETPQQAAVLGMMVGEDLYLVLFEQSGKMFFNNKKSAFELFKKLKLEVEVAADHPAAKPQ